MFWYVQSWLALLLIPSVGLSNTNWYGLFEERQQVSVTLPQKSSAKRHVSWVGGRAMPHNDFLLGWILVIRGSDFPEYERLHIRAEETNSKTLDTTLNCVLLITLPVYPSLSVLQS